MGELLTKIKVKQLTEAQAAYIAGIIDGEGGIAIRKNKPNKKSGEVSCGYLPYLKVGSIDGPLLTWLQKTIGAGTIYQEGRWSEKRKPFYTWHISNVQLEALLRQVYPYLVIKKPQADIIFRIRKTIDIRRNSQLEDSVLAERELCMVNLSMEHKRKYLPQSMFDLP